MDDSPIRPLLVFSQNYMIFIGVWEPDDNLLEVPYGFLDVLQTSYRIRARQQSWES